MRSFLLKTCKDGNIKSSKVSNCSYQKWWISSSYFKLKDFWLMYITFETSNWKCWIVHEWFIFKL